MNKTPRSLDDFASSVFDGLFENSSVTGVVCNSDGFTKFQGLLSFNITRDDERQDWKTHYDAVFHSPNSWAADRQTEVAGLVDRDLRNIFHEDFKNRLPLQRRRHRR